MAQVAQAAQVDTNAEAQKLLGHVYQAGNAAFEVAGWGSGPDVGAKRIGVSIATCIGGTYIAGPIVQNIIPFVNTFRDWGGRFRNMVTRWWEVSGERITNNPENAMKKLDNNLGQIVGQKEAKKVIKQKISSYLEERSLSGKSTGACVLYLFGDSGVGKSETANVIAKSLCGTSNPTVLNPSMLKKDNSKDAKSPVEQFLGNETVYGIAGEKIQYPTKAAQQIATNPDTVLIIEEIDKMRTYDPTGSIDEFLRQAIDRGYAIVEGRKLKFNDTIIIITSNESRSSLIKGCSESGTTELRTEVDHDFSLLNRLTLVEFGPLSKEEYTQIAQPQISKLVSDYLKAYKIRIKLDENFLDLLSEKCCQAHKGARCIHQYMDQFKSLMVEYRMSKSNSGRSYKGRSIELKFDDSSDGVAINEVQ
ncbi:MAG: AAA family ATPase [Oscillospiraceae bacterium]|nr:AAA family ATPase [Oscillospiraceae bacterium]